MKKSKPQIGRPRETMSAKPEGKKVVALRKRGLSFRGIGEALGFTKQRAHAIHRRVLAEQAA